MKQVARFVIGNPGQSEFNSLNIIKSSENSPIVSFHEFGDSGIDYDYSGNIIYRNINKIISDVKELRTKLNTKTETVQEDYNLSTNRLLLDVIEELSMLVKNFNIKSENYSIISDKFELNSPEIILGGTQNIDYNSEDFNITKYNADSLMTLNKFKSFYNNQFIPFVNLVVQNFDNHIHIDPLSGVTDVPVAPFKLDGKDGTVKVKQIDKLKSSTTVKAL